MSRVRIIHIISVSVLFFLLSHDCSAGSRGKKKAKSKGVQFSITLDKTEYKKTDPIQITFTLKNNGKKPIYVNKRFYVNQEDSPKKKREVYFILTSPSGEKLPYRKRSYETGLPKTDHFVLLKSGEEISSKRKRSLKGYFDIKELGKYKLTAVYQNVYGSEFGVDACREKITSPPVTIEITE